MKGQEQQKGGADKRLIEGTLRIAGKGIGFVRPEEADKEIEIDPSFLNTGLHGDRVRVFPHPHISGKQETGEISEIIWRAKMEFVGVLEQRKDFFFLDPQDPKMYVDIFIHKSNARGARGGQKVLAKIIKWDDPKKNPEGEVLEVIGVAGDNDVEMQAIVLDKGLRIGFTPKVERAAEEIKRNAERSIQEEAKRRRDMRSVITMTIDPVDAKDFDDALSYQELENGDIEVGVHIADVTHYVRPGEEIDTEAKRRATSIYLVDRTIPMLPEALSNNICSLRPDEDRLAFSSVFTFHKDSFKKGESPRITKQWFGETIIRSNKRFSYEDAQRVLDEKQGLFHRELAELNTLAHKLRKQKFAEGAIAMEQEEVKFVLDEKGKPIDVVRKVRGDSHKLIEDFMLLANKKVAEYASEKTGEKAGHFVYRIHPQPDQEKIKNLVALLNTLGYTLTMKEGEVSSKDINDIMLKAEGTAEQNLIQTATIRSMAKAVYSTKNVGHYGLAFKHYAHFTSPIRRYPDMMVHRLTKLYLAGKKAPREMLEEYDTLSLHSSQMEQTATEAERGSVKYKQVEYMTARVGNTYPGTISGVTEWGIYVEEERSKSEGMVRLRDLEDDYYIFDEKTRTITGQRRKKTYRLGDKVKIKVKNANLERRIIDYVFV